MRDLMIFTVVTTAACITLARWAWPAVGIFGAGLIVVAVFPPTGPIAFSVTSLLAIPYLVVVWRVRARSRE